MRLFEIIFVALLSIHLIGLFVRIFNQKSKKWFLLLTLLLFIFHLLIEGYRWQMIPSYLVMFSLILIYLYRRKIKKTISVVQNTILFFLVSLSVFLSFSLPVLQFKNLNNKYPVGIKSYKLIDKKRAEILTEKPDDFRELSIRVYYPTPLKHKETYPYIPNFEVIRHTYQKKLGWPSFLLDYLKLFTIDAKENAPQFENDLFPLIFYSHGLTNNYNEASGRLMNIASKGYVVVAINHSYSSDFAILSNKEVVGYMALSQLGDPIEKIDSVKTIIANQWLNDVSFVKDNLTDKQLSKNIDFENIGLMGFSAGGTMATLGSHKLDNIKASINLDGTPRGILETDMPKSPILAIFSEPLNFTDAQINAWGITRETVEAPKKLIQKRSMEVLNSAPEASYVITFPKTKHSNFIEYPLISPLSKYLDIGGNIDSKKSYEYLNNIIVAFLDENLKKSEEEHLKKILKTGVEEFNLIIQE